ncbi:MAG: hypothetical protein ABJF23_29690 [Bryobacteraceae bacterium]
MQAARTTITQFPPLEAIQKAKYYPAGSRRGIGFLRDLTQTYTVPTLYIETWGSEEYIAEGPAAEQDKKLLEKAGVAVDLPPSW